MGSCNRCNRGWLDRSFELKLTLHPGVRAPEDSVLSAFELSKRFEEIVVFARGTHKCLFAHVFQYHELEGIVLQVRHSLHIVILNRRWIVTLLLYVAVVKGCLIELQDMSPN